MPTTALRSAGRARELGRAEDDREREAQVRQVRVAIGVRLGSDLDQPDRRDERP